MMKISSMDRKYGENRIMKPSNILAAVIDGLRRGGK
jgi:hypothetical protein